MTSAIKMLDDATAESRAYPILYVDDEPQNLVTFRYAVEDRFTVLTAGDGREAVDMLEREQVAVLICDQRMPEMSGIEVCQRAREIRPDVVRIIVTAYSDTQTAIDAINQGQVLRYLTKPWRNDELVDVLQSAVELVRIRRTVHEMQVRMLRGGHPPVIEGILRQVASELRDPVSELQMNAEQVSDLLEASLLTWEQRERARSLVERSRSAHQHSERPLKSLHGILDRLSRGQRLVPPKVAPACDVVRVAQATSRILSSVLSPRIRLRLVISGAPIVNMDPADLGQVLVQLIMNSAQSVEDGSDHESIVIALHVKEVPHGAEIAISDHGSRALTARQQDRLFDPQFSTGDPASSLGLAVVKHLITQAGGTILAERDLGRSGQFVMRLPAGT